MAATGAITSLRRSSSPLARARQAAADAAPPLVALGIALVLWEGIVRALSLPVYLLPAPSAVAGTLVQLLGTGFQPPLHVGEVPTGLLYDATVTLEEAMLGLAIGTVVGLALGVLMAHSRFAEEAIYPIVVTIRSTPFISIAPIFIIWFGFTIMPKAIVAALATFYPMLVNSITGMRSVEPTSLEFFRSVHASRREVFWNLRVPNTLPYFFVALRLCVSLALIGAIVGELVGARDGLGHTIEQTAITLRTPEVFSGVIVLTVMGIVLTELVTLIQGRVLYWHESERG